MGEFFDMIIDRLGLFAIPFINLYVRILSLCNYLISLSKRDVLKIYNSYQNNQPVLVIALYERTYLRKDIIRLLEASKCAGLYVIAVNTLKLSNTFLEGNSKLFDVYISQYNYGRDFASYQKGFLYIFKNKLQQMATRIVMLNDSVYYDADRTPAFLDAMINTSIEVIGATENHEINYHLGSFAISFARNITNNPKFLNFWKHYRRTDVRPLVIKRGEMGLTKVLAKIVSNESELKALYDSRRIRFYLSHSLDNLLEYSKYFRTSDGGPPRVSNISLIEDFISHTRLITDGEKKRLKTDGKILTTLVKVQRNTTHNYDNNIHITNIDSLALYLKRTSGNADEIMREFYEFVISQSVLFSRFGSQIHQNNACFLLMGLPIIKLDGLFRGLFSEKDISHFQKLLKAEYFEELVEILYRNPFGNDYLHGWRRVAFERGII